MMSALDVLEYVAFHEPDFSVLPKSALEIADDLIAMGLVTLLSNGRLQITDQGFKLIEFKTVGEQGVKCASVALN